MTRIQEIQAQMKKEREEYLASRARLQAELEKARAEKKTAGPKGKKSKAKAEAHKPQDTTEETARRAYEAAAEAMKNAHPDHGGPGGPQFYSAHANWQRAKANYRPFM